MGATRKLRAVQVGCGGRAQAHITCMQSCGAVDLLALCDLDEEKLKEAGKKYSIPKLYHSMEEMIQKEKPELVDIVTPPTIRASIVEPAIKAGAPAILIEKPIALKPSEARRLVELGQDRLIAVNTQYQWFPHWQRFWPMLREHALGDIQRICCGTMTNILEQGPHVLDLALKAARLSGLPDPEWVLASCSGIERFGSIPVPADTSATIGLGDARMHFNQGPSAHPVPGEKVYWLHNIVDITGTKGRLCVTLNQGWKLWLEGKFESGHTGWPKNDIEAQSAMFVQLRDTLHGGNWREFPTRVQISAQISDVMFGCYASALGGGRIKLPAEFSDSIIDRLETLPK